MGDSLLQIGFAIVGFSDKCPPTVRLNRAVRGAGAGVFTPPLGVFVCRQRLEKIIGLGIMLLFAGLGG